jgi:Uma2 family endonuclease
MATATRVSLADFLAMEETKPYRELICGEVVEKEMPGQSHSDLVFALNIELGLHLRASVSGKGSTELRHLYVPEDRVYLPDISFISSNRLPPPDQDPVEVVPDFVIEVLSPRDRASRVLEKVQFYLRAGVRLLWVVDPERRTVDVYCPGDAPREYGGEMSLAADPVLPGFEVNLGTLFAQPGV